MSRNQMTFLLAFHSRGHLTISAERSEQRSPETPQSAQLQSAVSYSDRPHSLLLKSTRSLDLHTRFNDNSAVSVNIQLGAEPWNLVRCGIWHNFAQTRRPDPRRPKALGVCARLTTPAHAIDDSKTQFKPADRHTGCKI